jgi:hypothetical protein
MIEHDYAETKPLSFLKIIDAHEDITKLYEFPRIGF